MRAYRAGNYPITKMGNSWLPRWKISRCHDAPWGPCSGPKAAKMARFSAPAAPARTPRLAGRASDTGCRLEPVHQAGTTRFARLDGKRHRAVHPAPRSGTGSRSRAGVVAHTRRRTATSPPRSPPPGYPEIATQPPGPILRNFPQLSGPVGRRARTPHLRYPRPCRRGTRRIDRSTELRATPANRCDQPSSLC